MTLSIDLSNEQSQRLKEAASRLNVSSEELARAAINDLLNRQDPDFENAMKKVLEKNAELYRRLA